MITNYNQFKLDTPFYIFGSENSQDYDVIVSVKNIPNNINEASNMCKKYNENLSNILNDKPLNCNLGVFDGELVDVYKGTVEELNNCIYYTYKNHKQYYPNPIKGPIERDINEKILRVARFIITFYSRTELRIKIKSALRGDLLMKLDVLRDIDFIKMRNFEGKKEKYEDIFKVLAFQFGQVFSLIDGYEPDSYTKNGIIKNYPELSNFLNRRSLTDKDYLSLNKFMNRFINLIEKDIKKLRLTEYDKSIGRS